MPRIDGINALNIFGLAWVEHKLNEHKMNFKKETPYKTQDMKFFKQVNKYQKSSIKKDSGDEDWTELDWTRSIKNFWPSDSNEREMLEATMRKRR